MELLAREREEQLEIDLERLEEKKEHQWIEARNRAIEKGQDPPTYNAIHKVHTCLSRQE